jgi:hypothetical protein
MRKYKTNYRTRRPVKRFHIDFSAPSAPKPERAAVCEMCGGKIEEVMTSKLCFGCNRIRSQAHNKQEHADWLDEQATRESVRP